MSDMNIANHIYTHSKDVQSVILYMYYVCLYVCYHTRELDEMKKALREMQTLRAGCSKAEPKIFAPPQTPFPGARDGQNIISWRWSLQTQLGEDRCTQFRVIVVTDHHTHTQTHRQDRLQYTAPQLVRSVMRYIPSHTVGHLRWIDCTHLAVHKQINGMRAFSFPVYGLYYIM